MDLEISQLQAAIHTFRLLYHRNKNQHRRSPWWKWFSMLKRFVSKLIHEIEANDNFRAQARVRQMSQILLPRCFTSFTQLLRDTQFSTLGLTLVAELSRVWSIVAPYTDRAKAELGSATEPVDTGDTFPLSLSEDVGQAVGRTACGDHSSLGVRPFLAFDILAAQERGGGVGKGLYQMEGAGLDATRPTNGEKFPQLKTGTTSTSSKSYASSAPIKEQKQKMSANAIDDLFYGLD